MLPAPNIWFQSQVRRSRTSQELEVADYRLEHHDGFALFNFSTSTSKRSSIYYGPKRDFIGELLQAAKTYHPTMRRGTIIRLLMI